MYRLEIDMNRELDVLLVDDNQGDSKLILRAVSAEISASRVHVVRDGEEALSFIFARDSAGEPRGLLPLRLILLDLKLPKVDGFGVLAQVKGNSRTKLVPIVVLSSSNHDRDIQRSYELGANSYMQKPVISEEFEALVRRAIEYWVRVNQAPPMTNTT